MKRTVRNGFGGALIAFFLVGALGSWSAWAGQAEPIKIKGDAQPPTLIKKVAPVYPEEARKQRIEGTVILEATVDVKGAVQSVKILRSVPALDQAAIDAVKQWVYEPTLIDGKPRAVVFTVTVRFVLDKDKKGGKAAAEGVSGEAKEPLKAAGTDEPPTLIKKVSPVYPEEARKQGIEGTVILEATVDVKGAVQNVKILRSVAALDQAAVDAVKQWVYEPKVIGGKPVPVTFTVTVRFALDKDKKVEKKSS